MNTAIDEARLLLNEGRETKTKWIEDIARRMLQGEEVDPAEVSDACENQRDLDALESRVAHLKRLQELGEVLKQEGAARKEQKKQQEELQAFKEKKKAVLKELDDEDHELFKRGNHASSKLREIQRAKAELRRIGDPVKVRRVSQASINLSNSREELSAARRQLEIEKHPENTSAKCSERARSSLWALDEQYRNDERNPSYLKRSEECKRSIEFYTKTDDATRIRIAEKRHKDAQSAVAKSEKALKAAWEELCNEA